MRQHLSCLQKGLGISTSVGIGGDPINGSSHKDILEIFNEDDKTKVIMMIGEIGGPQEAEAAEYVQKHMKKPVCSIYCWFNCTKRKNYGACRSDCFWKR